MSRARGRVLDGYFERHHVLPKSLEGGDEASNIVRLTYREHFLAHWLLTKLTAGKDRRKMLYALFQMTRRGKGKDRVFTSWQYEAARRAIQKVQAGRKLSDETRAKISEARKGKSIMPLATRRKMSKRLKGNTYANGVKKSPETIALWMSKMVGRKTTKGYKSSEDTKRKISKSLMGNQRTAGRKLSPEHVAALRAGYKKRFPNRTVNL